MKGCNTILNDSTKYASKQFNGRLYSGFTLIELSIVIVVIGLIIGGIFVGKDLIKSAQVRAEIKQIDEFKTAASTFKVKYGALPGDLPPGDASQLGFFTFTGTNAGKSLTSAPWIYGFGNNDGTIDYYGETYVFWQHLSEAKLIAGQYGGSVSAGNYLLTNTASITTAGYPLHDPMVSSDYDLFLPISKLSNVEPHIFVQPNRIGPNSFQFSNTSRLNYFWIYATPYQQYSIDSKIDDGAQGTGSVRDISMAGCLGYQYKLNTTYTDATDLYCAIAVLW